MWLGKSPKYSTRWEDPEEWLFTPVEQAAWTVKRAPAHGRTGPQWAPLPMLFGKGTESRGQHVHWFGEDMCIVSVCP